MAPPFSSIRQGGRPNRTELEARPDADLPGTRKRPQTPRRCSEAVRTLRTLGNWVKQARTDRVPGALVELLGALSNPETGALPIRVGEALDGLGSIIAKHDVLLVEPRPFQGQILRAIREVLIDAPDGLRTIEVWADVERLLDRPVSKTTVKGVLAGNPAFLRFPGGLPATRHPS